METAGGNHGAVANIISETNTRRTKVETHSDEFCVAWLVLIRVKLWLFLNFPPIFDVYLARL